MNIQTVAQRTAIWAGGNMDNGAFRERLLPGERLVWTGQPAGGLILTGRDVFLIPFSIIWCGFIVIWISLATVGAVASGRAETALFPLFGLPFLAIGIYMVAGRFVADAWIRRRTKYAVTDRRVLILRSGPFSDFTTLALDRLPQAKLSEKQGGRGTIRFGQSVSPWTRGFGVWSAALDPSPQFLAIADVRKVFDLIQLSASRVGASST
jgi:hypothetical protein